VSAVLPPTMTSSGSASPSTEELLSVLSATKSKDKRPRADSNSDITAELLKVFKKAKLSQRLASPAAKPSGMCHHSVWLTWMLLLGFTTPADVGLSTEVDRPFVPPWHPGKMVDSSSDSEGPEVEVGDALFEDLEYEPEQAVDEPGQDGDEKEKEEQGVYPFPQGWGACLYKIGLMQTDYYFIFQSYSSCTP
jgi:hypothetical protein